MPNMRKAIAIAVADIHLSMMPPPCRVDEPDWFAAMARTINKLGDLRDKINVPILCAGDVFNTWNPPPELINFAMDWLPSMAAIPGQHDIPNHSLDHMEKSAFYTLIIAEKLLNVGVSDGYSGYIDPGNVWVSGFPWGVEVTPPSAGGNSPRIAVVHQYIWDREKNRHHKATLSQHTSQLEESLKGYHFAIFGDNHTAFTTMIGRCRVVNCGSLMRRRYKDAPGVAWILYDDGDVSPHSLYSEEDIITDTSETDGTKKLNEKQVQRFDVMLKDLENLGSDSVDFAETLKRIIDTRAKNIRDAIYEILEED